LCAGNYTVVVQDQAGCQATQTFQLINPPAITLAVNTTSSTCNSVADANITTTVNGGVPSYTLVWVGPSGTLTGQNLSNILSGNYTLSLTDQNGCQINSVVPVGTQLNVLAQAGNDTTYCYNTSSLVLNGNQSQNAVSYVWLSLPSQQTLANQSTVSVLPSSGTNTYVLIAVASNTNCYDMDTVIVNLLPLPDVDAGPTYSIPLYGSVTIGGNPTSGSATSFTWFPATGLSNINISNPVASNTVSTVYTVVVTGTNGCVAMDSVLVYVYPEIKIPNGFSPNGDGVNDTWIIDNLEQFPDNEVEIYNRWGELLFRSEGYKTPFDGKYKGKDLPVGTYYYVLKLNHPAYPEPYTGPLTIFR
jgi:gliding motility-associated-like protein